MNICVTPNIQYNIMYSMEINLFPQLKSRRSGTNLDMQPAHIYLNVSQFQFNAF